MDNFKIRLRQSRISKGMSQSALAKKADLHPSAIAHFESGRRKPSYNNLIKLIIALEVNPSCLLLGE